MTLSNAQRVSIACPRPRRRSLRRFRRCQAGRSWPRAAAGGAPERTTLADRAVRPRADLARAGAPAASTDGAGRPSAARHRHQPRRCPRRGPAALLAQLSAAPAWRSKPCRTASALEFPRQRWQAVPPIRRDGLSRDLMQHAVAHGYEQRSRAFRRSGRRAFAAGARVLAAIAAFLHRAAYGIAKRPPEDDCRYAAPRRA